MIVGLATNVFFVSVIMIICGIPFFSVNVVNLSQN